MRTFPSPDPRDTDPYVRPRRLEGKRVEITSASSPPPTSPLKAMLRLWPLSLAVIVLGVALGSGYASSRPTTFTANARLAVGGTSIAAEAIPGFALASQEIAGNYARFVSTAPTVGAMPASERAAVVSVSASPIPSSNVILIEATATSSLVAEHAVAQAATALALQVNSAVDVNNSSETLKQYNDLSAQVARAQIVVDADQRVIAALTSTAADAPPADPTTLAAAEKALAQATTKLSTLTIEQSAMGNRYQTQFNTVPSQSRLMVVQPAVNAGDDKRSRMERYGVLGLAAGFVIALLASAFIDRRRGRHAAASLPRRTPPEAFPGLIDEEARMGSSVTAHSR